MESRYTKRGEILAHLHRAADSQQCYFLPVSAGGVRRRTVGIALGEKRVAVTASRAMWILHRGDPGDLYVLHTCSNGPQGCIALAHLYLGTPAQNVEDALRLGTWRTGSRSPHAKMTEDQVRQLRETWTPGQDRHFSELYGVTVAAIRSARLGRSWKHLQP